MRLRWFDWTAPAAVTADIREWVLESVEEVDLAPIEMAVRTRGDGAVLELTGKFDATEVLPTALRVDEAALAEALAGLDDELRAALKVAARNIEEVAYEQVTHADLAIQRSDGASILLREVPVGSAAVYAPGGRAAYPSSVLMGCLAARAAGVPRVALASPPGPDATVNQVTLAAAALCEVDVVYAMGGAQAIFALAFGTETIDPVDVIAGPGNRWVTEAKRTVFGTVGIDSLAGPSELMVILGGEVDLDWIALDLCAQAEHGPDSPLIAVGTDREQLEALATKVEETAATHESVTDAPLALVEVASLDDALALANAFAPEHLQLAGGDAPGLAEDITTAGCVFVGSSSATAFGDYAAGSNHVLPTGGTGRFTGPLGPGTFRRKIANVTVTSEAAATLAPHVDALARAEGLPVHGASALARIPGREGESKSS